MQDLDLVVVGISNVQRRVGCAVVHSEWVLQLSFVTFALSITEGKQITHIRIGSSHVVSCL